MVFSKNMAQPKNQAGIKENNAGIIKYKRDQ
jgi:hypothetical protein